MMEYTKDSATTLLNRLYQKIEQTTHQDPHPRLIIAEYLFSEPYPIVNEIDLLSLVTMDLLIQFAYPSLSGYGKFTVSFTIKQSYNEEISFTLGPAVPLSYQDSKLIPMSDVYAHISQYVEIYDGYYVVRIMIRVYMDGKKMEWPALSSEKRDSSLSSIIQAGLSEIEPITARVIQNGARKRSHPTHITTIKPCSTEQKPFIVADTETLLIDNVHKPYAAGLLMVHLGEQINDLMIDTYFREEYSRILDSFEERSIKVLYERAATTRT